MSEEPLGVVHDLSDVLEACRRLKRWKKYYAAAGLNDPQRSEAARHSALSERNAEIGVPSPQLKGR